MWNLYSNPESVAIRFKPEPLLRQVERYVQINLSHPYIDLIVCSNVEYRPIFPPEYDGAKYTNPDQRYVGLRKDVSYESEKEYRMSIPSGPFYAIRVLLAIVTANRIIQQRAIGVER